MSIIRVRDGILKRVYMKELTQKELDLVIKPKTGPNVGKQIKINENKSHKINIEVEYDGKTEWFAAGTTKINLGYGVVWQRKIDDEWTTINPGAKIDFKAKENGDFNANIQLGTFDLIENGPEQENIFIYKQNEVGGSTPPNKSTNTYQKRDYTGTEIGHAINCALWVKKHKLADIDGILTLSRNLHDITKKLKEEYKEKYPDMSDYDLGASIGHSVLNSCRLGGSEKVIESNARKILDELVPPITAYVRGEEVVDESAHDHVDPDEIIIDDIPF